MKKDYVVIHVKVERETRERLKKVAELNGLELSSITRVAFKNFLGRKDKSIISIDNA